MQTTKLSTMKPSQAEYNETAKKAFHSEARKVLKHFATLMGLDKADYDLRVNKGGIAVTGEVTLHTDQIYVQIFGKFGENKYSVLYRTCKSRKDYSGDTNNYAPVEKLLDPSFAQKLQMMISKKQAA